MTPRAETRLPLSPQVLLNEGYNLASLLVKYRGLDWRDRRNWDCNDLMNPIGYDELTAEPLEVSAYGVVLWLRLRTLLLCFLKLLLVVPLAREVASWLKMSSPQTILCYASQYSEFYSLFFRRSADVYRACLPDTADTKSVLHQKKFSCRSYCRIEHEVHQLNV